MSHGADCVVNLKLSCVKFAGQFDRTDFTSRTVIDEPNPPSARSSTRVSVQSFGNALSVAPSCTVTLPTAANVQVSLIESEKLFSALVKDNLAARKAAGTYSGKFSALHHFLGYEGRCAFPSNFDADYCYSLGYNAAMLIQYGVTGYLSKVSNLSKPAEEWVAGGMPITKMMNIERRHGADKPVIRKALVELEGAPFKFFAENRAEWAENTCFTYPGAIQYYGPAEVCDITTRTLALEKA